jgi:hypothetical protein
MISTEDGMQIDGSVEHHSKAIAPIRDSVGLDSNVTLERFRHRQKHFSPKISTEEGMKIDESAKQFSKRQARISETFEPASNRTAESVSHPEKQPLQNPSMVFGTITSAARPKYHRIE